MPIHSDIVSEYRFNSHNFLKKSYRLFGMSLLKHMHILSKNKPFHTFWDVAFKCTHILSKNCFTLFGMWLLSARTSYPKTVSHFLGCACLIPQLTFTTRSSSPSIWPTNSSPFCTGPTPAGVPVMIISPACSTNNCDK